MKKVCPQCGKEFECKHNADCFCMQYTISKEALAILKEKYSNCICEDCLKQYAMEKRDF
ncbi:MAG: cysteine-rich CWC family protein [Bacteroidales bacterium]|nr:cysteine-rich CWC family protein [Bacteroidales bacterium]